MSMFAPTVLGLTLLACAALAEEAGAPASSAPREEKVAFLNGKQELSGSLFLPAGTGPFPVVIFVHGDGPAERNAGGYYSGFFKAFADAGIASFSWDKPGVGGSTNLFMGWRAQSYFDRVDELRRAIACLKTRKEIDLGGSAFGGSARPPGSCRPFASRRSPPS